jgi:hypothetical protein
MFVIFLVLVRAVVLATYLSSAYLARLLFRVVPLSVLLKSRKSRIDDHGTQDSFVVSLLRSHLAHGSRYSLFHLLFAVRLRMMAIRLEYTRMTHILVIVETAGPLELIRKRSNRY